MASSIEGYSLGWNDYANNFSTTLTDLLKRKELVDVTLIADGHLFNAHRLILSALSTYFQQMFAQMPTNQQAFVFLKDVPKEALNDLITFIYSGQVNVKEEHLEVFFNTAKALNIKGLTDGGCAISSDIQSPVPNSFVGTQYQSSRTTRVPDQLKPYWDEPSHFESSTKTLQQHQDNSENEGSNDSNENGDNYSNGYDYEYYGSEIGVGDSLDPNHGAQADQWNTNHTYSVQKQPAKPNVIKPAKRVRLINDISEYNIVADIRPNGNGGENLFHNEQKFRKSNEPNHFDQQRWACTKRTILNKCQAAVSTMDINGTVMMKIVSDKHSHLINQRKN